MKSVVFAVIASLLAPSMSIAAQGTPNEPWSRIRKWKPGAEVTVQTRNTESRGRFFISVDDEGVTLLNLSSVALPSDVARVLRQAVSESPDHFSMAEGVTFKLGDRAALSLAGLFIANQKIAEYEQVVERIARTDVDAGTVFLDLKKGWSNTKQILVAFGLLAAGMASTVIIACAAKKCD